MYRWKRKQLIPEEWFIRKSTFTGQETFFPRARILGQVQHILQKKDDLSLDELADQLSEPASSYRIRFTLSQLKERNIVSVGSLERFGRPEAEGLPLSFEQILNVFAADWLLSKGSSAGRKQTGSIRRWRVMRRGTGRRDGSCFCAEDGG